MLFVAPAHDAQLKTIKVCRRIDNCASWYWAQHGHRKEINHSAVVYLYFSCVRVESAFKVLKNKGSVGTTPVPDIMVPNSITLHVYIYKQIITELLSTAMMQMYWLTW